MPELSVKDFLALSIEEANDLSARNELRGKIASSFQNGRFTFMDLTNCVQVKLATEQLLGEITNGRFVKLVRPQRSPSNECLILDDNSRVFPARKIRGLENSEGIVESSTSDDSTTVENVKKLDPYQVIFFFFILQLGY